MVRMTHNFCPCLVIVTLGFIFTSCYVFWYGIMTRVPYYPKPLTALSISGMNQ